MKRLPYEIQIELGQSRAQTIWCQVTFIICSLDVKFYTASCNSPDTAAMAIRGRLHRKGLVQLNVFSLKRYIIKVTDSRDNWIIDVRTTKFQQGEFIIKYPWLPLLYLSIIFYLWLILKTGLHVIKQGLKNN